MSDMTALRLALHRNGYEPLPADGKAVYLKGRTTLSIAPDAISRWTTEHPRWTNTGLRTGATVEKMLLAPAFLVTTLVFLYLNTGVSAAVDPVVARIISSVGITGSG